MRRVRGAGRTRRSPTVAAAVLWAAFTATGCAGTPDGALPAPPSPARVEPAAAAPAGVPAGYGTLRQDDLSVSLRSGPLLIKLTPLDEGLIRLLAPDTYERLHALARSQRLALADAPGRTELFLVSFFSYEPNVRFTPENLQLMHRGRLLRAARIQPVTAGFGRQLLQQQETQSAIFVFDDEINYALPLTVEYGIDRSDDWTRILPRIESERARVRARSGSP